MSSQAALINRANPASIVTKDKSFVCLDIMRGFAALAVFLHHYKQQFFPEPQGGYIGKVFEHLGVWGITVFFVLSGFCIHWSEINRRESGDAFSMRAYLTRRFFRIYPAFIVSLIICSSVGAFLGSNLIGRVSTAAFISHITLMSGFMPGYRAAINAVLWTVVIEMHFYILYTVLNKFFSGVSGVLKVLAFALGLAFITYAASVLLFSAGENRVAVQKLFGATWWVWCLGALAAELVFAGHKIGPSYIVQKFLLLLFLIASLAMAFLPGSLALQASRFALPLMVFYCMVGLLQARGGVPFIRSLKPLGDISYSLYLLHPVILLLGIGLSWGQPFHFIALLFVSFGLSTLSYRLIERPFNRIGHALAAANV